METDFTTATELTKKVETMMPTAQHYNPTTRFGIRGTSRRFVVRAVSAKSIQGLVLANYFDTEKEVRLSDIRVELASLEYGAEIYVDIRGELPFSYYQFPDADFNGEDPRRNLDVTLN